MSTLISELDGGYQGWSKLMNDETGGDDDRSGTHHITSPERSCTSDTSR